MSDINFNNINIIKKEIKALLDEVNKKEKIIIEEVRENTQDILIYKQCLETIIEEYHIICKKIYK